MVGFIVAPFALVGGGGARIGRAHFHPLFQRGDFIIGKFFVLGHLQIRVGVAHRLDEQAGFGIAGDDGFAGITTLEQRLAAVEQQATFDFFRQCAVTLVTFVGENRPDVIFKKIRLGRCQFLG